MIIRGNCVNLAISAPKFVTVGLTYPSVIILELSPGGGGEPRESALLVFFSYLAQRSFSNADSPVVVGVVSVVSVGGVNFKGGKGQSQNASVTFSLFWHEASLG